MCWEIPDGSPQRSALFLSDQALWDSFLSCLAMWEEQTVSSSRPQWPSPPPRSITPAPSSSPEHAHSHHQHQWPHHHIITTGPLTAPSRFSLGSSTQNSLLSTCYAPSLVLRIFISFNTYHNYDIGPYIQYIWYRCFFQAYSKMIQLSFQIIFSYRLLHWV